MMKNERSNIEKINLIEKSKKKKGFDKIIKRNENISSSLKSQL